MKARKCNSNLYSKLCKFGDIGLLFLSFFFVALGTYLFVWRRLELINVAWFCFILAPCFFGVACINPVMNKEQTNDVLKKIVALETSTTTLCSILGLLFTIIILFPILDKNIRDFWLSDYQFFSILLLAALVLILNARMILILFRVKQGLYGTCDIEARKIIYFMLEQKKKNGPGGGMKLIFRQEELDELLITDKAGGEKYA